MKGVWCHAMLDDIMAEVHLSYSSVYHHVLWSQYPNCMCCVIFSQGPNTLHRKQIKLLLPEFSATENHHTYLIRDALIMTGMRKTASDKTRTAT